MRWLFVTVLVLAGCIGMGDSAARLRGSLDVAGSGEEIDCMLTLLAAGIEIDARKLQRAKFEETFVVPSGIRDYVVRISCAGTDGVYERELKLGALRHYRRGVDLGLIEF